MAEIIEFNLEDLIRALEKARQRHLDQAKRLRHPGPVAPGRQETEELRVAQGLGEAINLAQSFVDELDNG